MTKFETLKEFENLYEAMMPAQEKSQESFAWFSGLPHPFFNIITLLPTQNGVRDKAGILISKAPSDIPLSFWVHNSHESSDLVDVLKEKDFQAMVVCPLMAWTVKPVSLPKYKIELAHPETFHHVLATAFHLDEITKEGYAKLLENAEAENYLIYYEDQPVGTGTLIAHGKIGGIFNVATLPEYQRQGYGRAMMHFLMYRAASILELEKLILLSSPVAEKLYSDLDFTKCLDIEIYARGFTPKFEKNN